MSQRTPSHCDPIEVSVSVAAVRRPGENAFSWTTSGQGAKYGSFPFASTPAGVSRKLAGFASRSAVVPCMK